MKFDLGELNPGTWFDFGEDGGKASFRLCAGDDLREIRKACAKKRVEFKNGQRYEYDEINSDQMDAMIWDFCIVSWENFFDAQEKPIPCTKENKTLLMGKSPRFAAFFAACTQKLIDSRDAEFQALRKN